MRKIIWIAISISVIVAVGLASPLFYKTSVDESLPGRLDMIQDGLTVEKFMNMEDAKRQQIVEKMPFDLRDMIMQEAATVQTHASDDMAGSDITILHTGTFEGLLGHDATGIAKIIKVSDSTYLRFESFDVTNGPDLRVYLTNNGDVKSGHHLAKLKGSMGNQNYLLDGTDWRDYDTVVIYCQPFGVHFGQANLSL